MARVAILGAGIAGLSAAWLLKQSGIDFIVLEKQERPGGLARSFEWHGFYCDFAAHRLFSANEEVLQQLINLVPMGRHVRRSRIYLQGHWMRDPLDVLELAMNLSLLQRLQIIWSYIFRGRNLPEDSFKNYVIKRYGNALYDIFFGPYTEKLFGIPGDDISVLWARQKVRLANPLDNFRENTKTKFSYFYYPLRNGYGAIIDRLYQDTKDHVHLNAEIIGLNHQDGRVESVRYRDAFQERQIDVDFVISTLPMGITGRMLGLDLKFSYQKVDAVYLWINRPLVSDYHWIYFMDDNIAINRMVEFKNMSSIDTPENTSVLCAEVTQEHEDVTGKVINDLTRVGMIRNEEILDTKVLRENFAYPVYNRNYDQKLNEAQNAFQQFPNLYLVGRSAEFRHREADDNFASAMAAVQQIQVQIPELASLKSERENEMEEQRRLRVSAVILTYNHFEDTRECLESVKALETGDIEFKVILVDNGSSDGTPENVKRDFSFVEVIENNQNLGVPAGYNVGFVHALVNGCDYILMLNNDTLLAPSMLQELIAVAKADPKIGIVMPKMMYHGSEDVWSSGGRYRAFPPAIIMTDRRKGMAETTRMVEFAPSCALLIHAQAFERAGLFDPGYFFMFDDWDFSERVRTHGLNIWYAANAHLWHKVSRTTRGSGSNFYWRIFGSSLARYWRRHGRPVWFSLPLHVGYIMIRDIVWHRNTRYFGDFWRGVREGLQKPLGVLPRSPVIPGK